VDILGNATAITSVKYDMIITAEDNPPQTTKIWYKGNKMRMEMDMEGETAVILSNMDTMTMYMYYPDQNMAMKVTYDPQDTALDETEGITDYNPTILGTETLDGKVCLVVQYTYEGITTKMWIWKQYGFPIRAEVTSDEGLMVMEYKNIEFTNIDDSMFVLPDGVEIVEIPTY
jgi:outer membrane lipoprotein-sorting protein